MASSIITSVITGGTNNHDTIAEELNAYATDWVLQGVVGSITNTNGAAPTTGSFGVNQDSTPDMGVTINLGQAYIQGTPSSQDSQVVRSRMSSNYTEYTINSNTSGSTKYDWIYLNFSAANAANPDSAADNVVALYTSRSTSNSSDTGSPPTYGIHIATVTVANNASSITNANIADERTQAQLSIPGSSSATGWNSFPYALTYASNTGNKTFTVTTPSNVTGLISAGQRFNITRSVSPPTECMAFASASSQYASNSTATGISFTSAFSCEAWVYILSTGAAQTIMSRYNGTNGWAFNISSNGFLALTYLGSGTQTSINDTVPLPLNQWVHVAGVISSVSSKTGSLYVNGQARTVTTSPSSATSLTQAGSVELGAINGGTFLNGYISEARLWSVAITQATIQANMGISLPGSTTNLIGMWQGNGNFTDSTTNANNLTASGGAIATQVANPYNAIEYANVVSAIYSSPNTTITLSTGTYGTIPNQTLNNPEYSTAYLPYGFPTSISATLGANIQTGQVVTNTSGAVTVTFPTPYTVPPQVYVSVENGSGGGYFATCNASPTATSFTVAGWSATASLVAVLVSWVAIPQ